MEPSIGCVNKSTFDEISACSACKQNFNEIGQTAKMLSCRHYFCTKCIRSAMSRGQTDLYCTNCWKRIELELNETSPSSVAKNFHDRSGADLLTKNDVNANFNGTVYQQQPLLGLVKPFSTLNVTSTNNNNSDSSCFNSKCKDESLSSNTSSKTKRDTDICSLHAIQFSAWCNNCCVSLCRACLTLNGGHQNHSIKNIDEAHEKLLADIQLEFLTISKMFSELQKMQIQRREFQLKILDACIALKTLIESDLAQNSISAQTNFEFFEIFKDCFQKKASKVLNEANNNCYDYSNANNRNGSKSSQNIHDSSLVDLYGVYTSLNIEKQKMQIRLQDLFVQNQCADLISRSNYTSDNLNSIKQMFSNLLNRCNAQSHINGHVQTPMVCPVATHLIPVYNTLANYCLFQLLVKQQQQHQQQQQQQQQQHVQQQQQVLPKSQKKYHFDQMQSSNFFTNYHPLYYFNVDVNGSPFGRIVIEVRSDVAPRMAKNFDMLTSGDLGYGYKNCTIFQCWENESIITGDFEMNNGRGGRSMLSDDGFFIPDETKLQAVRGSVGMRRTQKKHDNFGMVGSQFRIIIQEMRGFTAIFGQVVEGLELVDKLASFGDSTGKPTKSIVISECGKLAR